MVFGQTGLASPSSVPVSLGGAAQAAPTQPGAPAVPALPGGGRALGTLQTPFPWQASLPGCWARPAWALPGGSATGGTGPGL